MLGDDEHPISFHFEPKVAGEHTHVTVRAGIKGSRAVVGELVFRSVEWAVFRTLLETAPPMDPRAMDRLQPIYESITRNGARPSGDPWSEVIVAVFEHGIVRPVFLDESPVEVGVTGLPPA